MSRKNHLSLPNVIVITLGGVRNSDSIEDKSHQFIRNMHDNMFKQGTLYTNLINTNVIFHMPSVQSVLTGRNYNGILFQAYPDMWGACTNTIFEHTGRKYKLPHEKLWAIGHWEPRNSFDLSSGKSNYPSQVTAMFEVSPILFKILDSNEKDFIKKFRKMKESETRFYRQKRILYNAASLFSRITDKLLKTDLRKYTMAFQKKFQTYLSWPPWDSICAVQYNITMKVLKSFKPKLLHYFMGSVESAHYDSFARYVLALKSIDKRIFSIWEFIQKDPYYRDNTYLIVNIDHGRDRYYMDHDRTAEPVWLYIYGPGIKKGKVIEREVHHSDIFATVSRLMGVADDKKEGTILEDCFTS